MSNIIIPFIFPSYYFTVKYTVLDIRLVILILNELEVREINREKLSQLAVKKHKNSKMPISIRYGKIVKI